MAEIPVLQPIFGQMSKRKPRSVNVSRQKKESHCGTQQSSAATRIRRPAAEQHSFISMLQGTDSSSSGSSLASATRLPTPNPTTRYDYFSPCSGAPLYSRSAASPPHRHFSCRVFCRGKAQCCTFALCPCNMLRRQIYAVCTV